MGSSTEKLRNKKAAFIFIAVITVLVPAIWFGMQALATESVIEQDVIELNGKPRIVKLSEKTNNVRTKIRGEYNEENKHYGYFIELVDSISKASLAKLKFKSPVWNIQSTPVMITQEDGDVWIISTTNSGDDNRRGFILKFSITNDKINEVAFTLEDKYRIFEVKDNKVMLGEGSGFYHGANNPLYGDIFLDLETEKIVDERK